MEVLHGIAAHPGVAIASAARLGEDFGVPSLSPERLRRLGERLRSFGMENPEPEQIILIADRIPPGFWLSPLPGLEIIGLAAGTGQSLSPAPDRPVVVGLGEALMRAVEEEDIIIVDGDRGRVYVSPDAQTVARYQAPFTLARRFFLEGDHLPARTASDNRVIAVFCAASTLAEAEAAMKSGADGLVVGSDNDFLGGPDVVQTAGEQAQTLGDLARIIGGQPLVLDIPPERLACPRWLWALPGCPCIWSCAISRNWRSCPNGWKRLRPPWRKTTPCSAVYEWMRVSRPVETKTTCPKRWTASRARS